MDALDAFDHLYGTYTKAHALLKAALDYEELNGPDDVLMTIIETSFELIQSSRDACGRTKAAGRAGITRSFFNGRKKTCCAGRRMGPSFYLLCITLTMYNQCITTIDRAALPCYNRP